MQDTDEAAGADAASGTITTTTTTPAPADGDAGAAALPMQHEFNLYLQPPPAGAPASEPDAMFPVADHIAAWLGEIISSLFPWPALIGVILFLNRKAIGAWLTAFLANATRFREVAIAGVKLSVDPDRAQQYVLAYSEVVHKQLQAAFDKHAIAQDLPQKVRDLLQEVKSEFQTPLTDDKYRATIHVNSIIYPLELYQLLEYEPAQGTGQTRARRLSIRFGIIGRAWRTEAPAYDPEVSTSAHDLVHKWGMTLAEAKAAGAGKETFLAVPIKNKLNAVCGIFYLDAVPKNAFKPKQDGSGKDITEASLGALVTDKANAANGLRDALWTVIEAVQQEMDAALKKQP